LLSVHEAADRRIGLLRGFEFLHCGNPVKLPFSAQRVIAFLALQNRPVHRLYVAGALWLDASESKANASLRTALWRLGLTTHKLVEATPTHIALAADVEVDVAEAKTIAESVIAGTTSDVLDRTAVLYRAGEILPDWYEDWVLIEREHFRQLRLHALEALCEQLTAAGRFAEATEAGGAAVKAEPLRESAHRVLIKAFLAEGNSGEALRQYDRFQVLLGRQLGLEPSQLMEDLIGVIRPVT
jgi:DNA-binding SARP family transcriptional activator